MSTITVDIGDNIKTLKNMFPRRSDSEVINIAVTYFLKTNKNNKFLIGEPEVMEDIPESMQSQINKLSSKLDKSI